MYAILNCKHSSELHRHRWQGNRAACESRCCRVLYCDRTHVAVEDGVNVVLVVALDGGRSEEEVSVGCSIAPLQIVDLRVSSVPLVSQSQDQLDTIVGCSVDDVVQSLEDCLIVHP